MEVFISAELFELAGHSVVFEEIPNVRDVMEVWLNDEKIYTCNIKGLQFGNTSNKTYLEVVTGFWTRRQET